MSCQRRLLLRAQSYLAVAGMSAFAAIALGQTSRAVNQAASAPSGEEPLLSQLTGISIQTAADGGQTTIEVATSRRTDYRVLHLENPDRLVLDLEGAQNGTELWRYSSHHSPLLERVRVGRLSSEYGGIIRVDADLRGDPAEYLSARWPNSVPAGFEQELDVAGLYWRFRWLGERPDWRNESKS